VSAHQPASAAAITAAAAVYDAILDDPIRGEQIRAHRAAAKTPAPAATPSPRRERDSKKSA
jgi:hypothetical protein